MIAAALALVMQGSVAAAQMGIPRSVAAAEAEGAVFPRGGTPAHVSPEFARPLSGTAERRCVAPTTAELGDPSSDLPLRSGEFLVRGGWAGEHGGLMATRPNKFSWLSLHNPLDSPNALLIRAARAGHPDDEVIREATAYWGYPGAGREHEGAFMSGITFPKAGTWLVIVTAGNDWGCFLFRVASR